MSGPSIERRTERLAGRVFDMLVRFRVATLLACLAVAGAFSLFVSTEIDTSMTIWFLDDDPAVASYDAYVERFDSDEFVAIALQADDVFAADVLRRVDEFSRAVADRPSVVRVQSLATAEVITLEGDTLSVRALFDEVPDAAAELERIRARVHDDPMLRDLVGDDDAGTIIMVEHVPFDDLSEKGRFAEAVRDLADDVLGAGTYRAAGNAFVDDAMQRYTHRDLQRLAPMTLVMIIVVTFALFRNAWCTFVPSLVVGMTLGSAIGFAGLLGERLNMITTIVIPLSMAVGIADSVHVIAGYRERLQRGIDPPEALRSAWVELLFPCVVTTATTAVGLLSLLSASLEPIRQFGWLGAVTVVFALLYTLALIPPIFSMVSPPTPRAALHDSWIERLLGVVAGTSWRWYRVVLVTGGALVVLGAVGVTRVETGADFQAYFKQDDPLLRDARFIDAHLGGTSSIDVLVEAADVRDPEVLRAMLAIQRDLEANPAIVSTTSLADVVEQLHETWFGDPERHVVPNSLAAVAQLLSLVEGADTIDTLVVTDYGAARIRGRVRASEYRELLDDIERLEAAVGSGMEGLGHAEVTGVGKLVSNLDVYIVSSQIRSFILAFTMVGALMVIFFRSFHIGLWALVPNALPIVFVVGLMGWAGVQLDVATVMVASIMLGLIVDDTVHYLARYRLEYRALRQAPDANEQRRVAERTGVGTGRAIATTSIILCAAFLTSLTASFRPNIHFGALCALATFIALVCDLVALPAVIRAMPLRWERHRSPASRETSS